MNKRQGSVPTKKQLAIELSKLKQSNNPKLEYEQYQTPGDVAADLLWISREDITNKSVVDLGCGNGILSIGAAMLGAKQVTGVDIDGDALAVAIHNLIGRGLKISFVKSDIERFIADKKFDTCIMNPPFGIQGEKGDKLFLTKAFQLCDVVYSIHKAESNKFLESFSSDSGFSCEFLKEFDFPIRPTQEFHKRKIHRFKAGFWRFRRK